MLSSDFTCTESKLDVTATPTMYVPPATLVVKLFDAIASYACVRTWLSVCDATCCATTRRAFLVAFVCADASCTSKPATATAAIAPATLTSRSRYARIRRVDRRRADRDVGAAPISSRIKCGGT